MRGANGEDLSHCVAAVEFTLHPSFEESTRRLTKAPFEVTETGWGEFDIGVKMEFCRRGRGDDDDAVEIVPDARGNRKVRTTDDEKTVD